MDKRNENIKFSIIVPIYKVENYIDECVQSILTQTYKNIEIILVNDGSPDKCPDICEEYKKIDNRIIVIHKKNGGLVSARQAGAKASSGDYICCVDGDDFISPRYVEKFADVIEQYKTDIVCCGYYLTTNENESSRKLRPRFGFFNRADIQNEIFPFLIQSKSFSYFHPTVWGKAIKRELYLDAQLSIDPQITMGEDGVCTIPCIYKCSGMFILEECLYYYRTNQTAMTKGKYAYAWEGQLLIANQLYKLIDTSQFDFQDQMYRRITKGFFTVAKSQFNRQESYWKTRRDILDAMKNPIFSEAIAKCKIKKFSQAFLMLIALKCKWIFMIYLYNRIL